MINKLLSPQRSAEYMKCHMCVSAELQLAWNKRLQEKTWGPVIAIIHVVLQPLLPFHLTAFQQLFHFSKKCKILHSATWITKFISKVTYKIKHSTLKKLVFCRKTGLSCCLFVDFILLSSFHSATNVAKWERRMSNDYYSFAPCQWENKCRETYKLTIVCNFKQKCAVAG